MTERAYTGSELNAMRRRYLGVLYHEHVDHDGNPTSDAQQKQWAEDRMRTHIAASVAPDDIACSICGKTWRKLKLEAESGGQEFPGSFS